MDDSQAMEAPKPPRRQCTANSRQTGNRCRNAPIPGGLVCRFHGGALPQVRDQARIRLAALVEPAIETLDTERRNKKATPTDRIRAANSILDRAGYGRVSTITIEDARDLLQSRIIRVMETDRTLAELEPDAR